MSSGTLGVLPLGALAVVYAGGPQRHRQRKLTLQPGHIILPWHPRRPALSSALGFSGPGGALASVAVLWAGPIYR